MGKNLHIRCVGSEGMYLPNICLLCCKDGKSVSHILLHCPFVVDVWSAMLRDFGVTWISSLDVLSVLSSWRTNAFNTKGKKIWSMVPTAVCWVVLLERNNRVIESYVEPSIQVYRKVKNLLFWSRRIPNCDDDLRGGLIRDWDSAIGLF